MLNGTNSKTYFSHLTNMFSVHYIYNILGVLGLRQPLKVSPKQLICGVILPLVNEYRRCAIDGVRCHRKLLSDANVKRQKCSVNSTSKDLNYPIISEQSHVN